MSIVQVLLLFAGVPLCVYLIFASAVYLPGFARRKHYKPGEPWDAEPMWFVPQPDNLDRDTLSLLETGRPAIEGSSRTAIGASARPALPAPTQGTTTTGITTSPPAITARGGAHGDW